MIDFELWKNEIIDSITDLHDETKLIREFLEEEQDVQKHQEVQDDQDDQEVQDDQDDQEVQDDQDDQEVKDDQDDQYNQDDIETIIIQKLDDINDSINILNKTVVESSIVVSISIILALAFHYLVNQISKW